MQKWIVLDRRKTLAGALLAAAALVVCGVFFSPAAGVAFAAVFLFLGLWKLNIGNRTAVRSLEILWCLSSIGWTFLCAVIVNDIGFTDQFGMRELLLNLLCIGILCGIVLVVTGRLGASFMVGTFLALLLITANWYVYQFRGKELLFCDLLSVGTAANVAAQYDYAMSPVMVYGWLLWGAFMFSRFCIPRTPLPRIKTRVLSAGAVAVLLAVLMLCSAGIPIKTWTRYGSIINGYYLNFYLSIRDSALTAPEDYSADAIRELESQYADDADAAQGQPNIIVIMSESFADLDVLGGELQTDQPVTPFIDSLADSTIHGYALSSVYGGNTANSEFEFLSGLSMAGLPAGSVAYQQYIDGAVFSLPWLLRSYGYQCAATHPYLADGWSRPTVYPLLGFERSTFIDDYPQAELWREYVSDREMYRYVLDALNQSSADQPMFLFGVTMQNHGGYNYDGENYTQTIRLEGGYPQAEQYLSLLHETDAATEWFLSALEECPRDTIVLFFGDHQPKLETAFYEALHGGAFDPLSQQELLYTVPFFIWANYEIPAETVECTSLNYLGTLLLEAAGLPLSAWHQFLSEMREEIPAINAFGYYSRSQGNFIAIEDAQGQEKQWLEQYAMLQYNSLVDDDQRSDLFFGQYLAGE